MGRVDATLTRDVATPPPGRAESDAQPTGKGPVSEAR